MAVRYTMPALAAENGSFLVLDHRLTGTFPPRADEAGGRFCAFSFRHRLPAGLVDQPATATGLM
jgi:hypothetical protein